MISFKNVALFSVSLLLSTGARAAVVGSMTTPDPVSRERILRDVPKDRRAAWLAYLDRSEKQMTADRAALAAERKTTGVPADADVPGGHNARSLPLDRDASFYGSAEAAKLATNLLSYQTPAGGWSKNLNFGAGPRKPGQSYVGDVGLHTPIPPGQAEPPVADGWLYVGTIDNDATTTEIRFLAHVAAATHSNEERKRDQAGALRGVEYLLHAQYPNGGWPQVWPLQGGYHDAITYNDDAMISVMEVLADAASGKADISFAPAGLRGEATSAVQRGIDVILRTQIKVNGVLAVWCQQHDALTEAPVGARNYEMPSLSSSESASLLDFLMRLPHPAPKVRASVEAGAAWLKANAIHGYNYHGGNDTPGGRRLFPDANAAPVWARYYSLETGKPIFGDRDKTIHDVLGEISAERRNGYGWYNSVANSTLERFAVWKRSYGVR
jgi:PelA/Pel-15E family pectate lyase